MSRTADRDLPRNIYYAGGKQHGYIAVIRHNGVRYPLGGFTTVAEAQAMVDQFRAENPRVNPNHWKPGDKVG